VKGSVENMNDSSDQRRHVDDGKRDLSQFFNAIIPLS